MRVEFEEHMHDITLHPQDLTEETTAVLQSMMDRRQRTCRRRRHPVISHKRGETFELHLLQDTCVIADEQRGHLGGVGLTLQEKEASQQYCCSGWRPDWFETGDDYFKKFAMKLVTAERGSRQDLAQMLPRMNE